MWEKEYHGDSQASATTVFALLTDTSTWPEWNAGVAHVESDGPFVAGATATMVLPDRTALPFRLVWVEPGRGFEDETQVPDAGVVVRVGHLLERRDGGGTAITFRCAVEGPDDVAAEVGTAVSADFPDVIAALAERAERAERAGAGGPAA
jgi:uncharacterized protein YndB with AHSA1/START domain